MKIKLALCSLVLLVIVIGFQGARSAAEPLSAPAAPPATQADDPSHPAEPVKLIFIHHSCGGNWLADGDGGLGLELMNNYYFVSATNYGWSVGGDDIGGRTDIGHWWEWFRGPDSGDIVAALYDETGQNFGGFGSWSRLAADPGGENEIIMFKSCYPNSKLGGSLGDTIPDIDSNPLRAQDSGSEHHTVPNAQGIYIDLLNYFADHQDKLFIAVTAPPMVWDITPDQAANARDFNDWLVNDWLTGYAHDNVAVFDFFNVLTSNGGNPETNDVGSETGNHHRWWSGAVQHIQTVSNNIGAYGDDHPNSAGNQKATAEFVPLLNVFYNRWKTDTPTTAYTFNAVVAPADATAPVTFEWSPEPASGQGTASATYEWSPGTYNITLSAANCGGTVSDERTVTVGAAGTAVSGKAVAQTMVIFQDGVHPDTGYTGTSDTILASDYETDNVGAETHLETYYGGGVEHRSLMRWDLSLLPADITVSDAAVELYRQAGAAESAVDIALYRVTREWTEGDGYFTPSPGNATWITATADIAWTTEGGDYDAAIIGQTTIPASAEEGWVHLDATAAVQSWAAGSEPNYGLLLLAQSGEWVSHHFDSRQSTTPTLRPRLVVTYTTGAPAPELTLISPNGGEDWTVGSQHSIQWSTSGTIANVSLAYSTDDFGASNVIESSIANSGSYAWTIPDDPSTLVQVRVASVVSSTIYDDSDAYFDISAAGAADSIIYLPLVVNNYASQPVCPIPLTGVSISGPDAPPSGELVQPADLTYLGAFRLPDRVPGAPDAESWEYSGQALTYRPDGDPGGGGDGYPGSLFGSGHDVYNYISEIGIPAPSLSRDLAQLPMATTIQGFHDIRDGLFADLQEMQRVGLQYLPAQGEQTSAKLHLAWGAHHQDEGSETHTPSHAWSEITLSVPDTAGAWWVGDDSIYRLYSSNGYIFEIPAAWSAEHMGGARLATGRYRDGGWSGMGPNIFAYGPWLDGNPPAPDTILTAHTLLAYSFSGGEHRLDNYHDSDEWEGGAWATAGERSAVLFVGAKGGGDYWWYGYSSPAGDGMPCVHIPPPDEDIPRCYNAADGSDCAPELMTCEGYQIDSKGWWSSRFDAQILFYDPADMTAVANGTLEPYEPQPYATLDIDEYLFLNWPAETNIDCGVGDQRKCRIGETAYDRERGLLYVLERFADETKPVAHVWRVEE